VSSRRRRRTVSARLVGGVLEIRVPHWMPEREREQWAERMRARIERQLRRAQPSDDRLEDRGRRLNSRHFGGRLRWTSIAFSERQESRWGSCSYLAGVIRVAERAARLPDWVLDYIVVHELAHLEVAEHSAEFWELVNHYPLAERARGYLTALDHQAGRAAEAF
jgi:predicted metal-dependent hydrolase